MPLQIEAAHLVDDSLSVGSLLLISWCRELLLRRCIELGRLAHDSLGGGADLLLIMMLMLLHLLNRNGLLFLQLSQNLMFETCKVHLIDFAYVYFKDTKYGAMV